MKDRIYKLLQAEHLTPSRFAEILDVQPSSISHLLSGRNKPSFDFITKVLTRFPNIDPDWLLLGDGTMYRDDPHRELIDDLLTQPDQATPFSNENDIEATSAAPSSSELPIFERRNKTIERIIICYKDQTFTEYYPDR